MWTAPEHRKFADVLTVFTTPVIVTPSFVFHYGSSFCLGDYNNNVEHISMQNAKMNFYELINTKKTENQTVCGGGWW